MARSVLALFLVACVAPLTFAWPYGEQPVRGVNLGGWLVLEKWMTPNVFSGLPDNVNDEYKLTQHLGYAEAEKRLRSHWDTWVTEADIIKFKNAGLNHATGLLTLRTANHGFPEVGTMPSRLQAGAGPHGLQVMMDLHGAPGSQNGNDHSGQSGSIGFYYNDENLQRSVNVVRQIARWANASEWRNTVSIIQTLNEPILWDDYDYRLGRLKDYYGMAYHAVREVNDLAVVAVHDAFIDLTNWYYFRDDPQYWWVMLDTHLYQVFGDEYQGLTCEQHAALACRYRDRLGDANSKLWTVVGEWSLATPHSCNNQGDIARQQIGVYENSGSGYFFWSHNNGQNWAEWSMKHSLDNGWIRPSENNVAYC
ncbi:Glucan 1,3-beta-glucosidase [Orchesella cincta]|uniref:glucan 1,3-beta-glucosidase n=1 Tax=Orchesella cincta TaxID=48709 RepID=A0A1D2NDQ7_ORCCI|nr:Glucan 1,3-beta-glucosidase [Orchesella cincta]